MLCIDCWPGSSSLSSNEPQANRCSQLLGCQLQLGTSAEESCRDTRKLPNTCRIHKDETNTSSVNWGVFLCSRNDSNIQTFSSFSLPLNTIVVSIAVCVITLLINQSRSSPGILLNFGMIFRSLSWDLPSPSSLTARSGH